MASLSEIVSSYASKATALVRNNQVPVATGLALVLIPLLRTIYLDYRGWYNLGAGGIPHNAFGWTVQSFLRLIGSGDTKSTACYDKMMGSPLECQSFIVGELPAREGDPPTVGRWVAPHRQLVDTADSNLVKSLEATLVKIVASNAFVELHPSKMEGHADALFLEPSLLPKNHAVASRSPLEVYHIHQSEGSSHGIFSATDAKLIIRKGWGERHRLSGGVLGIPIGYVMIYAPRSEQELQIIGSIAKAAIGYGLEGKVELS